MGVSMLFTAFGLLRCFYQGEGKSRKEDDEGEGLCRLLLVDS